MICNFYTLEIKIHKEKNYNLCCFEGYNFSLYKIQYY